MKTLTYHTIDKSAWSRGPWDNEPDKMQWQDEATGLPCIAKRNPRLGHWCGYVGVSEVHPLFSQDYSAAENTEVHGGLTYSNFCEANADEAQGICHLPEPGEPAHVWWFGFDCAHCWDISPGMPRMIDDPGSRYRSLPYVQAECASLAKQLAALPLAAETKDTDA